MGMFIILSVFFFGGRGVYFGHFDDSGIFFCHFGGPDSILEVLRICFFIYLFMDIRGSLSIRHFDHLGVFNGYFGQFRQFRNILVVLKFSMAFWIS